MKHNFKNLNIWKLSLDLANEVYTLTDLFPKNEEFGLKIAIEKMFSFSSV